MSLQQLKTNLDTLAPNTYHKDGKWYNVQTGVFDLQFDSVEGVFDYYSQWSQVGKVYTRNYAFLDGMIAKTATDSAEFPTDCPSAHIVKKWLCNAKLQATANNGHRISYVVNISATPAVLQVYAKNDSVTKCSLDANKYVDTSLNKVVYKATYANGTTSSIDIWTDDIDEELVVYNALNCSLGARTVVW
jgi:hypothetical protein